LALWRAAAVCIALPGLVASFAASAQAGAVLEERKMPMRFTWIACEPDCRGWVGAVGIVTGDTVKDFDEFAKTRDLTGATVVLDSSGGSVNDAIAMGRRWRKLGLLTTVGTTVELQSSSGVMKPAVLPQAYCESMCVFLLLSGKTRYVPEQARVRVHQIWMGDRAEEPKAASYTANDLMIVERDIGRLAKYTFDMGGTGDLLSLSLAVPPWDDLHRLSEPELKLTNLVTTTAIDDVLPDPRGREVPMASVQKSVQDRFVSAEDDTGPVAQASAVKGPAIKEAGMKEAKAPLPAALSPVAQVSSQLATQAPGQVPNQALKATKTAEATVPTGGTATSPAK
jgi:hypothetical protein